VTTSESGVLPLESIVPPDRSIHEHNREEVGGNTIVVRPPTKTMKPRTENVSQLGPSRSREQQQEDEPTPRSMLVNLEHPQLLPEARDRDDGDHWYGAWLSEVDAVVRNKTWVIASLPDG